MSAMDMSQVRDPLIVYGARCVWWDSIDNVGHLANGLPCCPHCGSVLFQTESTDWWANVAKYQEDGHPGYHDFIRWLRGRCFRTLDEAQAAHAKGPRA